MRKTKVRVSDLTTRLAAKKTKKRKLSRLKKSKPNERNQ